MEALPPLPPKPRDRADRTVYRRGAMAVRVVNGVLRPVCTVCFKRATFGCAPPVRGGRSVAEGEGERQGGKGEKRSREEAGEEERREKRKGGRD